MSNGFVDDEHEVIHVHHHIARDNRKEQLSLLNEQV